MGVHDDTITIYYSIISRTVFYIEADVRKTRNKYHNVWTKVGDRNFQSQGEAKRYQQLRNMEAAGTIENLQCQKPRLKCLVNNLLICTYVPDFTYQRDGVTITEDYKGRVGSGHPWAMFSLKRKLVKALHGIDITVSTKADLDESTT